MIVADESGEVRVVDGGKAPAGSGGAGCPAPGAGGRPVKTVEVKDGKVYRDGEEIGRVPGDRKAPLTVSVVDGEVRIGEDGRPAAGTRATRRAGAGGEAGGPAVTCVEDR